MTTYRVAVNHNVALVSLVPLDPQPRSEGVKVTRRRVSANGSIIDEGKYVDLIWDVFETVEEYQDTLDAFDLDTSGDTTKLVTVYARDETFRFARYNGTAVRPEIGPDGKWDKYFARGFTILVRDLVELA
jgi:hypothetical protein